MRHKLVAALFASAFLAVATAVGVSALSPASAQAEPTVLAACEQTKKVIDATKLPAVWELEKCPVKDRVIRDVGVGSALPAPGQTVYAEALTPSGAQELTITRSKNGTVEIEDAGSEAHAAEPSSGEFTALSTNNECSDSAYTKLDWRVEGTLRYSFNRKTTPRGITRDNAERAIRSAANNVSNTKNVCRLGDRVPAKAAYMGNTTRVAHIDHYGDCPRDDGRSIISFGKMSRTPAIGVACVWSVPGKVYSSDIKFNTNHRWTTNPRASSCNGRYDLASVATHEFGHTFGLDHPRGNHPDLTMNSVASSCSAAARTLGRGDVLGLGSIYR